jgi:hypothetical protein
MIQANWFSQQYLQHTSLAITTCYLETNLFIQFRLYKLSLLELHMPKNKHPMLEHHAKKAAKSPYKVL